MTPADWFEHLYRDIDDGWISLLTLNRDTGHKGLGWFEVGDTTPTVPDDACVWFGVATRRERLGDGKRGGIADCAQIPALWVDIDVAGEAHAQQDLPPDLDAAHQLLKSYPLAPTAIVNSGNGLQAWWKLTEPIGVDEAVPLLAKWGTTWTALAQRHNWRIDNVWDVARVMRLPGTHNTKTAARPLVTVDTADWSRTFGVDDISEHLLDAPAAPTRPTRNGLPYVGRQRPGDAFNSVTDPGAIVEAAGGILARTDSNGDRHYRAPHRTNPTDQTGITVYDDGHTTIYSETFAQKYGFQVRTPYDAFGLYARINHGGNIGQASAQLRKEGFGADNTLEDLVSDQPDTTWPEPIPLYREVALPEFPIDALPEWAAAHARAVAHDLQTTPDLTGLLALGAMAVACTTGATCTNPDTGQQHPLTMYLVCSMPPSAGKSPAIAKMFAPLKLIESERIKERAAELAQYESDRRMEEQRQRNYETAYAKTGNEEDRNEALNIAGKLALSNAPINGRIMVDDITTEALGIEMQNAGGAISIVSSEGGIFDIMAGIYNNNQANTQLYLKAWSQDYYSVSRVGRSMVEIVKPTLSLVITVQPIILEAIGRNEEFRGRGLIARCGITSPPYQVGHRNMRLKGRQSEATAEAYEQGIRSLSRWAQQNRNISVGREAMEVYGPWAQAIEERKKVGMDLHHMTEWVGKIVDYGFHIAGLIHAGEHLYDYPVSADTFSRATAIADHLLAHAANTMGRWGVDAQTSQANVILDWLRRKNLDEFSIRDIYKSLGAFRDAESTRGPLKLLVERDWVRSKDGADIATMPFGRGGKASPRFVVNPRIKDAEPLPTETTATHRSENRAVGSSGFSGEHQSVTKLANENLTKPGISGAVGSCGPVAHKGEKQDSSISLQNQKQTCDPLPTVDTAPTGTDGFIRNQSIEDLI